MILMMMMMIMMKMDLSSVQIMGLEPFRLVGTFLQTGSLVTQSALKTPWKMTTSCMEQEVEVFLDCAASCLCVARKGNSLATVAMFPSCLSKCKN